MEKLNYHRLSFQERVIIQTLWTGGYTKTAIANQLGRHKSTISREINKWESHKHDRYDAKLAHWYAHEWYLYKHYKDKISLFPALKEYVYKKLHEHWSPEQIAGRIKLDYPNEPVMSISHESIYAHIYRNRQAKVNKKLIALLPQQRSRRRRNYRSRGVAQFKITDRISIDQRPESINNRSEIGHWEGDLIIGYKRASALTTLVERKTRFTYIAKVNNKKSETVTNEIKNIFCHLPKKLRQSLTYDNGVEMADHKWLTNKLGTTVYFTHPYSSWERGTNENTNGIIRRYLPKQTDFHKVSHRRILELQNRMNNRPRKVLNYRKPIELFPVKSNLHQQLLLLKC